MIGGAFRAFRQRFGQFVALALIPAGIMVILMIAASVPLILGIFTSVRELRFSWLIALGLLLMFAALVVGYLAQIKIQAMITLGTYDVIHQRPSTAGELARRTSGVVGRVLLLVLGVLAAVFVAYGLLIGISVAVTLGGIAAAARSNSIDPGAAIGTVVVVYLITFVLMAGLGLFIYYLAVRFLYLLPGLAVENLSAVEALRRSWRLTKGNFLRTLGYILIATVLVSLAGYAVSLLGQLMLLPAASQSSESATYDPVAAFLLVLPGLIVTMVLSFAVQVLTLPFLTSYITVMYVDQLRRNALPAGYRHGGPTMAPGAAHYPQAPQQPGAPGQWRPVNPPYPGGGQPGPQPPQPPGSSGEWGQQPPPPQWGPQGPRTPPGA